MQLISWFVLGLSLSAISVVSINRTISMMRANGSMKSFWTRYIFRLVITGLGLLLAVQWGVKQILAVFLGLITFRMFLLLPRFTHYFSQSKYT